MFIGQTKCTINDRQKDNSNSSRENYRLNIRLLPLTSQRIQQNHRPWRKENVEKGLGNTFLSLILFLGNP
ncbi:hypothetical protein Lal_00039716 [Lupinus albus]|nr:hypothetical protein Lal_00039716 [Lupinus albus]